MSFSQADITGVNPPIPEGADLYLSWTSTAPTGTMYQVYVDRMLSWHGVSTFAIIPMPQDLVSIIIGTVGPGEGTTDFSSSLPATAEPRARLTWIGGTFEGADIAGFHIYRAELDDGFGDGGFGMGPFGDVDTSVLLGDIQAYTPGIITDGFGFGGFGLGGFGQSPASYEWISGTLTSGTWAFAVIPYDLAGNEGVAAFASVAICTPPLAPARFPDGSRLHYSYNATTHVVVLTWNASET